MTLLKALFYLVAGGIIAGLVLTAYFLAFARAVKFAGKDPSQPWVPLSAAALLIAIAWFFW